MNCLVLADAVCSFGGVEAAALGGGPDNDKSLVSDNNGLDNGGAPPVARELAWPLPIWTSLHHPWVEQFVLIVKSWLAQREYRLCRSLGKNRFQ